MTLESMFNLVRSLCIYIYLYFNVCGEQCDGNKKTNPQNNGEKIFFSYLTSGTSIRCITKSVFLYKRQKKKKLQLNGVLINIIIFVPRERRKQWKNHNGSFDGRKYNLNYYRESPDNE